MRNDNSYWYIKIHQYIFFSIFYPLPQYAFSVKVGSLPEAALLRPKNFAYTKKFAKNLPACILQLHSLLFRGEQFMFAG